jgi:hypothetical protein
MAHDAGDASYIRQPGIGSSGQRLGTSRDSSLGYGCGVGRTILRVFEAAECSSAGAGDEQKHRRDGRSLQAGEVIHNALAENLVPTPGRQRVERFVEAQMSACDKIRVRLDHGMRIGEHSERQDLLALFLALRAGDHVPLELVDLIVRQLPIRCRDDVFMCKFAVHSYVLLAPKEVRSSQFPVGGERLS